MGSIALTLQLEFLETVFISVFSLPTRLSRTLLLHVSITLLMLCNAVSAYAAARDRKFLLCPHPYQQLTLKTKQHNKQQEVQQQLTY